MALYDRIGTTYTSWRRSDPHIAAAIDLALGSAQTVLNVGAGTGSYEPANRQVIAVEPSAVMIAQRAAQAAPVVRAVAEALPFADGAFDAAMAILTVHHWQDLRRGLAELRRVARRVVVLTHDATLLEDFWLIRDYLPGALPFIQRLLPPIEELKRFLPTADVRPVPVPGDCEDGFLCAFWRRPHAYLDRAVRDGISCFPMLGEAAVADAMQRLERDLGNGAWSARNQALDGAAAMDFGYRLLVAE
ncbi:MAG: class I SAM-dependent methyltransferase [Rhodobacteraceae bacterium]|nr:class I SAM-dependent methyltransferase [Paracoccaceae bacterium]